MTYSAAADEIILWSRIIELSAVYPYPGNLHMDFIRSLNGFREF